MTKDIVKSSNLPKWDAQLPKFPGLVRTSFFDELFNREDDFENAFFQKGGSPCDIVEIKNDNGETIANEFSYALAGYAKDNVSINVDGKTLTISVEKTDSNEDKNRKYIHKGLTHKKQQWSYVLNNSVDVDNISASMENGILKVFIPIGEDQKQVKQIEIN